MAESFLWEQLFWRWNFCIFWHQSWIIFIWWFLITVSFTVSSNHSWRFGNIFCSDFRYVLLNWSNCDFENIKMVLWSWWHIYQIKGRVISNHAFKGEVGFCQRLPSAEYIFFSSQCTIIRITQILSGFLLQSPWSMMIIITITAHLSGEKLKRQTSWKSPNPFPEV